MSKRGSNLVLIIILSLPVLLLQYSPATPIDVTKVGGRGEMFFCGWPYVAMAGEIRSNGFGVVAYKHRKLAVFELAVETIVSLSIVILAFIALNVFLWPKLPRLHLIDILAFTAAMVMVTIYFRADLDIFGPYFRIRFVPDGLSLDVRTSDRPIWQNAISSLYILLSAYGAFSLIFAGVSKVR